VLFFYTKIVVSIHNAQKFRNTAFRLKFGLLLCLLHL